MVRPPRQEERRSEQRRKEQQQQQQQIGSPTPLSDIIAGPKVTKQLGTAPPPGWTPKVSSDLLPWEDFSQPNQQYAQESGRRAQELYRNQGRVNEIEARIDTGVFGESEYSPPTLTPAVEEARLEVANKALESSKFRVADLNSKVNRNLASYPTLQKAMLENPNLSEADVKRVVNFGDAWIAAERIEATEGDSTAVTNILLTMNEFQRSIVFDILEERAGRATELARGAVDEQRSFLGNVGAGIGAAWNFASETVLDPLMRFSLRAQAARGVGQQERGGILGTIAGGLARPSTLADPISAFTNISRPLFESYVADTFLYWNQAGNPVSGNYNEEVISQLRSEYGNDEVDLMLELQRLHRSGDESPMLSMLQRYAYDENKTEILRALVYRSPNQKREEVAERWRRLELLVNSANQGDPGQITFSTNPLTGEPLSISNRFRGSSISQSAAAAYNVGAILANDPLNWATAGWGGTGVRAAYLAHRYPLAKIMPNATDEAVLRALSRGRVRAYINDFTRDLGKFIDAEGPAKAGMATLLTQRYSRYFPEDVIQELAAANVRSADDFAKNILDSNQAIRTQMKAGKEAGLPFDELAEMAESSVFARMMEAQKARRGVPILPRNSILGGTAIRRRLSDVVRTPTRTGRLGYGSKEYENMMAAVNDPAASAGQVLSDAAEAVGKNERIFSKWRSPAQYVVRSWDKVTRLRGTTFGTRPIYLADARDTDRFEKFARIFVSRGMAKRLAYDWRIASEGQRRLMWSGIVRTAVYARGFDDIAAREVKRNGVTTTVGDLVQEMMVGTGAERYSPDVVTILYKGRHVSVEEAMQSEALNLLRQKGLKADSPILPKSVERSSETGMATADDFAEAMREVYSSPSMREIIENAVDQNPSLYNGRQHALHLDQLSSYASVPNLNDISLITKRSKLMQQMIGTTQNSATRLAVDSWSLLTLAGPRYSMRNALEDWVFYAVTGGKFMDAVKGRAMSVGTREARGQKIGFFARRLRQVGSAIDKDGDGAYPLAEYLILPKLSSSEVAAAREAASVGDLRKLQNLVVQAVVRTKMGRTLNKQELRYLEDFANGSSGYYILDEVTELARHLNGGTYPGANVLSEAVGDPSSKIIYLKGPYTDLSLSGKSYSQISQWHSSIERVAARDGALGKIALENLDNPQLARKLIAEEIRSDPNNKRYMDRFSAIYEQGMNPEDFASRYVQDVTNTFSNRNGSLNRGLLEMVAPLGEDGKRVVTWRKPKLDAEGAPKGTNPAVTVEDLVALKDDQKPRFILGRQASDEPFEIPVTMFENVWDMMGNGVARLSREPIFFGNYLSQRRMLSSYEDSLREFAGEAVARRTADRMALDRAMNLTLSYTDNPGVQSVFAWRIRNFARYYRAIEDFWRRVYRSATFEPASIYKTALTIGALDESGFIHTDMNGEKYFVYPGSDLVNGLLGQVFGSFGDNLYASSMPLIFTGRLKMVAPSADPEAAIPTLSSPVSAFLVKSIINLVPAFRDYEQALLGDYAENVPMWAAVLPAPVVRLFGALSRDERDSAYASAFMNAAQVLEAAGMLPEPGESEEAVDQSVRALSTVATTILATRFVAGFLYIASPQVSQNDVTTMARKYGIPNMSSTYLQSVNKYEEEGDPDPWGRALAEGVATFGIEYTPYAVRRSGRAEGIKSLPFLSRAETTLKFVQENPDVTSKFPTASMFIAPVDSDTFSNDTQRWLRQNGFIKGASVQEYMERLRFSRGKYVYDVTKEEAERDMANARSDDERKQIRKEWDRVRAGIYADFPGLSTYVSQNIQDNKDDAKSMLYGWQSPSSGKENPSEMRALIDYYYESGKPVPQSVKKIDEAIATWDYFTPLLEEIKGQSTKAARERRSNLRADLIHNLRQIGEEDPNAQKFIERVMYRLLGVRSDGSARPF